MPDVGLYLPPATRLVSLAERPDLCGPLGDHNVGAWPAFMLESACGDLEVIRAALGPVP